MRFFHVWPSAYTCVVEAGELVIVMDDEGRENEGDFIMAAELATPEKMAFLVRYSRCVGIESG